MGIVRTTPQDNGNTLLEITYGGKESPFGGVDTSAPPAYIDPRCFSAVNGFLIVDGKLCAMNWQPVSIPTLFGGAGSITLIKIGTFYNSLLGQINYALGYEYSVIATNPLQFNYIYYLTAWQYDPTTGAPVLLGTDVLVVKFFAQELAPVPASITLGIVPGESSDFTDSGTVSLVFGNGGSGIGSTSFSYTPGTTANQVITAFVTNINAGSLPFTAAATLDGLGIILTAKTGGAAGNQLWARDDSDSSTSGLPPAYYFPVGGSGYPTVAFFQGGVDAVQATPDAKINPVSSAEVGGVLYLSNLGPMVLKYMGPGTLTISSVYSGYTVIRKFAGSLIGLGSIPQIGAVIQNSSMIFSWSAAEDLDEWNPEDINGNVTGAGFEQLADIGDYLAGLIVSNGTAFILRSQGISYASPTGNATLPFNVGHIGLGDEGEGAQNPALVCQYDETGVFVGNTDIYGISGTISPIGSKVKNLLFGILTDVPEAQLGCTACAVFLATETFPLVMFVLAQNVFIYLPMTGTWLVFGYTGTIFGDGSFCVDTLMLPSVGSANILFAPVIAFSISPGGAGSPTQFITLIEGIPNTTSLSAAPCSVTFPQEEELLGRDVTIDAIYLSFFAKILTASITIVISINGLKPSPDNSQLFIPINETFATITLTPEDYANLKTVPYELQVFPTSTSATGVFTSHSPQVQIEITNNATDADVNIFRLAKAQLYGSFDPNQRPV